jgi:hypothetical protein
MPEMYTSSPRTSTSAPSDAAARMADAPSPFNSGRRTTDSPLASVPTNKARMVCDFDGGMVMEPESTDGRMVQFMAFCFLSFLRQQYKIKIFKIKIK